MEQPREARPAPADAPPSRPASDAPPAARRLVECFPALGAAFVWGWGPILIMILGRARFDAHAQNLYRYVGAVVFFLPLAALVGRRRFLTALRAWPRFLAPAAAVATFQTAWVMAIYRTAPTVAAFAEHSSLLIGVLGGAIFFADERRIVKSRRFIIAAAAVVAGFTGIVLGGRASHGGGSQIGSEIEGEFGLGVALLAVGAVAWASYALLVKRVLASFPTGSTRRAKGPQSEKGSWREGTEHESPEPGPREGGMKDEEAVGPLEAFAVTLLIATAFLLVLALARGDLGHVARVETKHLVLLFASGVLCVGGGQVMYFVSIRRIGVVASQVITLAAPFLTGVIALAIFGERMSIMQWLSGTLLVAGVAYLMLARRPLAREDPPAGTSA